MICLYSNPLRSYYHFSVDLKMADCRIYPLGAWHNRVSSPINFPDSIFMGVFSRFLFISYHSEVTQFLLSAYKFCYGLPFEANFIDLII